MRAMDVLPRHAPGAPGRVLDARRSFGMGPSRVGVASRLREYRAVGSSRRFRAIERRRTVTAGRAGFLVIAAAAAFDALALLDLGQTAAPILFALNGAVVVLALAGWSSLGGRLRRTPVPITMLVTLALAGATAATGSVVPALAVQTFGYLILIPGLIALIVPWSTRDHVAWLLGYAVVALGWLAIASGDALPAGQRGDLLVVAVIAVATSLAGHVLLRSNRVRNHAQLLKIQALHRKADEDMAELARVHHELEITARVDQLTGAGNRIRMHEDLRAARARMDRLRQNHGLVAIDLDHFKRVNDRFGHLAGDTVLREVVGLIQESIRGEDHIYRFGGEEFLVLLRVSNAEDLAVAMERLREAVQRARIAHPDNAPVNVVTISLGGVLVTPDDLVESDDDWFAKADSALYRAKANGRNRVELAA
jgi:diguanylate cyclase (GGDEF)-like protein